MSNFAKSIANFFKILKLNYQIYKINKKKSKTLKELGIIVYEFYNVDKSLVEDEEVEALILEIKDYEIEIDSLEKLIENIKNPEPEEKEEISNELLLNIQDKNKEEMKDERENSASSKTS